LNLSKESLLKIDREKTFENFNRQYVYLETQYTKLGINTRIKAMLQMKLNFYKNFRQRDAKTKVITGRALNSNSTKNVKAICVNSLRMLNEHLPNIYVNPKNSSLIIFTFVIVMLLNDYAESKNMSVFNDFCEYLSSTSYFNKSFVSQILDNTDVINKDGIRAYLNLDRMALLDERNTELSIFEDDMISRICNNTPTVNFELTESKPIIRELLVRDFYNPTNEQIVTSRPYSQIQGNPQSTVKNGGIPDFNPAPQLRPGKLDTEMDMNN